MRKALRRIAPALATALIPLAAVSQAAPAQAATLTCSSSTPISQRPTIGYGDRGTCVAYAQGLLKKAFFYSGPTTGYWNSDAQTGMAQFATAYRALRRDGSINAAGWTLLEKVNAPFDKFKCGNGSSDKVLLVFDDLPTSTSSYQALIDAAKTGGYGIGIAPNGMHIKSGLVDVNAARARGLLVVDHTYDHYLLTQLSYDKVVWEITQPYNGSNYVRPPYGGINSTVESILAKYKKNDCLWNVDPRDWAKSTSRAPLEVPDFKVTPQQAADYIVGNAWGGSTVVVHLNHLGSDASLLRYIDNGLRARGLSLCRNWGRASNASMPNMYCL
ncbi:MAG: polysaccharide deacetylase family protein [Tetrasphaera sp.]|nr:polysaccharide deacetylase family protein [Tetrasphaera sp.]